MELLSSFFQTKYEDWHVHYIAMLCWKKDDLNKSSLYAHLHTMGDNFGQFQD